jgi:pilus assembly protein TadC
VLVADGLTTPFWILGGLYLWRKQPLGYVSGAGLLFQASMLFVGLLAFLTLQPFVAGVPFPLEDFLVILVMGLVVFVPFELFLRGMFSSGRYAPD